VQWKTGSGKQDLENRRKTGKQDLENRIARSGKTGHN
jgi:hypothetical protein